MAAINMLAKIKNSLVQNMPGWIVAALAAIATFLIKWAFPNTWERFAAWILATVEPRVLLGLLCIAVLAFAVLFAFYLTHLSEDKLKVFGGIYWDNKKNPYCPSCKTPLGKYGVFAFGERGYHCTVCKLIFPLADASGNSIKPEDALRKL